MMQFDLPRDKSSIIKVIGVGGGGSNAVNHMFRQGIKGVDFIVCNTDNQALDISPVPIKIQIGPSLTEGRGAGSIPDVGRNSAIENIEDIRAMLSNSTKMVFITAGMGGGTGTGAAPIIAMTAREMGILTVGIVTLPFAFEGKKRKLQAEEGIEQMRKNVDTLLVISNDKLREIHGNLKLAEAFAHADNVLTTAAKGIAEIITVTGYINVDFEDVKTVMSNSGVAIMGSSSAEGDNRALLAVEQALASPLLNDNQINGARYILLNIASGTNEVTMDEITEITDFIQSEAGSTADIIWGNCYDETLGEKLGVTIIATGFKTKQELGVEKKNEKIVLKLEEDKPAYRTAASGLQPERKVIPLEPEIKKAEPAAEPVMIKRTLEPELKKPEPVIEMKKPELQQATSPKKSEPVAVTIKPEPAPPVAEIAKPEPVIIPEPVASTPAPPVAVEVPVQVPVAEVTLPTPPAPVVIPEVKAEPVIVAEATPDPIVAEIPVQNIEQAGETPVIENAEELSQSSLVFEFEINTPAVIEEPEKPVIILNENKMKEETPVSPVAQVPVPPAPVEKKPEPAMIQQRKIESPVQPAKVTAAVQPKAPVASTPPTPAPDQKQLDDSIDEQLRRSRERIMKLKALSMKLTSPSGVTDLEKEPAYKRRNVKLDETPHSSTESEISRYTLSIEEDGKKPEIKPNNPYLHDNVD